MTLSVATPAPSGLLVDGDVDELRTVLSNLLDNAVKYSRDDVQVAVEVAAPVARTRCGCASRIAASASRARS